MDFLRSGNSTLDFKVGGNSYHDLETQIWVRTRLALLLTSKSLEYGHEEAELNVL